jgi:hypothetical protein
LTGLNVKAGLAGQKFMAKQTKLKVQFLDVFAIIATNIGTGIQRDLMKGELIETYKTKITPTPTPEPTSPTDP